MPVLSQTEFSYLRDKVLGRLKRGLAEDLYYHCPEHTEDVLQASRRIARAEGVEGTDLELLELAALYHDNGFLESYEGHEEVSCRFARAELPDLGLLPEQIQTICGIIMATQLPQKPENILGEIICDADLDYLGREDFWEIGDSLFRELLSRGVLNDEKTWNRMQLDFLSNHRYFTQASQQAREPLKQVHLQQVREIVANYERES